MNAYPTREQAESLKADKCGETLCEDCEAERWCGPASWGTALLAMHDALYAKQAEIDSLKALLHIEAEANNAARDEIDRLRTLVPKTIKPTVDADGFYACECGHIVGCDGREKSIRYLKKPFCADCGTRIDWTGIQVWEWVHGVRVTVVETV